MSIPLNSANFARLLDKRLTAVTESRAKFQDLRSMIKTLFANPTSQSAFEEFFDVGGVPDISDHNGKIRYVSVAPGFHKKVEHKQYSGGIQVERQLIDDKKFAVLDNNAAGLMDSAYRVREKKAARAWQNAFSTAYDYMTSEEGKAWCSDTHLTKSGVSTASGFDNCGTSALTKTSVAATRLAMRRQKTDIGERFEMSTNLGLVVPDNLADTAYEIVGTPNGYATADHTKNMDYERYTVIPYMRLDDTDTNNWFMVDLDRLKSELAFYDRIKPEYKTTIDFDSYNILQAVYMRISYGFKDWRSVFGHNVS